VLAAIRTINRLECTGGTLRAALNSLATVVPAWIKAHAPDEWYDRYEVRMENFRFPKEKSKQEELANQIGRDGWQLLQWVWGGKDHALAQRHSSSGDLATGVGPTVSRAGRADPLAFQ
jgi:transposase